MSIESTRRLLLPALCGSLLVIAPAASRAEEVKPIHRSFEVRETAGIRRHFDVVTATLPLPDSAAATTRFQLLRSGEPMTAQFRINGAERIPTLVTDFVDHFAPLETQRYTLVIHAEDTVEEPAPGLMLRTASDNFYINSAGVVDWTIPRDLKGLLQFSYQNRKYVRDDSVGLFFEDDSGKTHQLSERTPHSATVERDGPIASSLRFDYADWPPGAKSSVQLEFYRTKSWIHVVWTIAGAADRLRSIGVGLNLLIEGPEVLVDFGAGDFVYTTAREGQTTRLQAEPRSEDRIDWSVLHGTEGSLVPIVVAPQQKTAVPVPGWAHVMGEHRCTALALAEFGESSSDQIAVDGNGRLTCMREFPAESEADVRTRSLEFWLHFVTMPVHIGARTSARSMQEPLEVVWDEE
ncbi:MAG: hypothetical protein DWQ34_16790 [Planctomycetota bacterium]|nr:MAG: hypothetical protein DWQ34_16790 [Planctomycetota bacterium]